MTLKKAREGLLVLSGAAETLMAFNEHRHEGVVQNKGANPISVLECDEDADDASLLGKGIVLEQYERHYVLGTNRISVIGTAADVVVFLES